MRSNHDDRPAASSEEGRGHGPETVKRSGQIRHQYFGPRFFTVPKKELAPSYPSIADEYGRGRYLTRGRVYHLLHRMRLPNISTIERSSSIGSHHLPERLLGRRLVAMVMDPDRPTSGSKGEADRSANPSGCTGYQHCTFGFASWRVAFHRHAIMGGMGNEGKSTCTPSWPLPLPPPGFLWYGQSLV